MKIGVFGGCFNPPHRAHKNIAQKLLEKGYVDIVIFVPTGDEYRKPGLAKFRHRVAMLEQMLADENRIELCTVGNTPMGQYTYQVLDYLQEKYESAELYFVCGTDNLNEIETWRRYKYVLSNYRLLVIRRGEVDVKSILKKYKNFENRITLCNIDSEPLSSTMIREYIASDDKKVLELLDESVLKYIRENDLYKEGSRDR